MAVAFDHTEILKENEDTYYNMSVESTIKEEECAVKEFDFSIIKGQDLRKPNVYDQFVAECKKQGLPIPPAQHIEHGHHPWLRRKPSSMDNTFSEMVAQWAPGELKWYRSNEIATSAQPLDLKGWEYVAHIAPPALS